jgi:muramoyltetrapeptide carboxypeptidase LdcA involved in peptidoglycan recycling
MDLIKPLKLEIGDTIGIFTPSSPAYCANEELFLNGVKNIEKLGFKVKLGFLTEKRASQGYRSGTPQDRAKEFMDLINDNEVKALISTIGGMNLEKLNHSHNGVITLETGQMVTGRTFLDNGIKIKGGKF